MTTRTDERVGDWESVPFAGGYEGLHELADEEFSGAVIAGPTRLFMLNGTVVGILGGEIEDFEEAAGTAREAPHEALPLLAVMQDRADEVRAQYYTEETAVSEVDRTLADGKFTGFIELSENVLSGDYYVVYHQGRSMSVAYVGASGKLITDDEAFDQANDEVGIYEVKPAEITPVEIPAPETSPGSAVGDDADDSASDETDAGSGETATPVGSDSESEPLADSGTATGGDATAVESEPSGDRGGTATTGGPPGSKAAGASQGASVRTDDSDSEPVDESAPVDPSDADAEPEQTRTESGTTQASSAGESQPAETEAETTESRSQPGSRPSPEAGAESTATEPVEPRSGSAESQHPGQPGTASTSPTTQSEPSAESGSDATAADLETRSIPSLDPEKSTSSTDQTGSGSGTTAATTADVGPRRDRPNGKSKASSPSQTTSTAPSKQPSRSAPPQQSGGGDPKRVRELETELEDRESRITDLERELGELETTTEDLRAERDRLQSDLEDARTEIERLQRQLEDAQGSATSAGTRLTASEAISNTNLFVRYYSKGKATLAKAHDGEVSRDDVEENLRLEYHTQFEADDAAVGGEPFEAFLHGTMQYRFVDWLIHDLLYEIRETGHESGMQDLYDAIPKIDRAELNGQVSITFVENGEEHRSQERFDVVVRDRMGNPLIVANMNDSREPASEKQMTTLVRDGERVGNASETLAAAFLVTSSFFEPGALETAEEATSSGLFSRDKRESYVNLSRKDGYHLCLLEARNQEFHLAVPEL